MKDHNEKIPDPKELEKEISEFLVKKFGENVKIVSPMVMTQEAALGARERGRARVGWGQLPGLCSTSHLPFSASTKT